MDAIFNRAEAVLWFAVAIAMAVCAFWQPVAQRKTMWFLATAFAAFGVSDVIESQTGAWWEPWWLLVLKAACVLAFIFGFRRLFALRRE